MSAQKAEAISERTGGPGRGGLPLKVAIVGFGTVGRSVAKVLSSGIHPSLSLVAICNRGVERKKVDWVAPDVRWTDRLDAVIESDVDIVVELIGGLEPAGDPSGARCGPVSLW
jgi:homoserine dehydrogenase